MAKAFLCSPNFLEIRLNAAAQQCPQRDQAVEEGTLPPNSENQNQTASSLNPQLPGSSIPS